MIMGRAYNDHAYIAAGWVNSIVESYNPIRDEGYRCQITAWQYWLHGSRTAESGKSVYSFGNAQDGKMIIPLDSQEVQRYNLNNDIDVVGGLEVISYDYLLHLSGGYSSERQCTHFDARSGWKVPSEMSNGRHGHSALLVWSKMYVFGRYNNGFVSTVKYYDFQEKKWAIGDPIEIAHCQAAAAFIHHLNNWRRSVCVLSFFLVF